MRATALMFTFGIAATIVTPGASADGVRVTGAELVESISGKTYTGTTRRGGTWEASYKVDGTYDVRVLNSDWTDNGTWEVKDDRICTKRTKRAYMCFELMRVSEDEYLWVDERRETEKTSGPK